MGESVATSNTCRVHFIADARDPLADFPGLRLDLQVFINQPLNPIQAGRKVFGIGRHPRMLSRVLENTYSTIGCG